MRFEDLNTFCAEVLLNTLSESDAWRIAELFPEHKEAAEAVLKGKQEINVDDVSSTDATPFLKALKQCCNVKKLTFSRCRVDDPFKEIPDIVAKYCPLVEELDISGLNIKNFNSLSKLRNLRKVNLVLRTPDGPSPVNLFKNNPQLTDVTLAEDFDENSFDKMPKGIQKFKFTPNFEMSNNLMSNIRTWDLRTLILRHVVLEGRDIETLYTQKQLVCLHLEYCANNADLKPLFANNPRLEEVSLCQYNSRNRYDYTFLNELPKSVKKLRIRGIYKPGVELTEYLKTSNLEELFFSVGKDVLFPEFVAVATNLKVLGLDCSTPIPYLSCLKHLTKLKHLKLIGLRLEDGAALKEIMQSCVNLEKLELGRFHRNTINVEDGFASITALPCLKELHLANYFTYPKNFHDFVNCLGRNQTLSSVVFIGCDELNGQDMANLVKNCKSLKEIVLARLRARSADLIVQVSAALDEQTDRENVLHMVLDNGGPYTKKLLSGPRHSLLEISLSDFSDINHMVNLF